MNKIILTQENIEKLTEMTFHYYRNEFSSFKIAEICLFCKTPTESMFINWFEFLYLNILPKLNNLSITKFNNIIEGHMKYDSIHPVDYVYSCFIINK